MENPDEPAGAFRPPALPPEILRAYPPNRDALFALIRPQITDATLEFIAAGDNGEGFEEHLAGLKRIRAGVGLDAPMGWEPNEVLCLFRWSDESLAEPHFADSIGFHLARAFCCGALLRIPDRRGNRTIHGADTLIQLIESCRVLGTPYPRRLLQQIVGSVPELDLWSQDDLLYALGLVCAVAEDDGGSSLVDLVGEWYVEAHALATARFEAEGSRETATFRYTLRSTVLPNVWRKATGDLKSKIAPEGKLNRLLASADDAFPYGAQ